MSGLLPLTSSDQNYSLCTDSLLAALHWLAFGEFGEFGRLTQIPASTACTAQPGWCNSSRLKILGVTGTHEKNRVQGPQVGFGCQDAKVLQELVNCLVRVELISTLKTHATTCTIHLNQKFTTLTITSSYINSQADI